MKKQLVLTNNFFERIQLPLTRKKIILIDFNNQHGLDMYSLLSNPLFFELNRIKVDWRKLESEADLQKVLKQLQMETNNIICIPLAWNDSYYNNIIQELGKNNIIVAPYDKTLDYPWVLSNVYCANHSAIECYPNESNKQIEVEGYSVYCTTIAIVAVKGRDFLKNFMEGMDNEYL